LLHFGKIAVKCCADRQKLTNIRHITCVLSTRIHVHVKILCYTFSEDFASSSAPAAKRTKSESKAQVKDSKRNEKENDDGSDNKAAHRRCNLLLIFKLCFAYIAFHLLSVIVSCHSVVNCLDM